MVEAAERLVRTHQDALIWCLVAGWAVVGLLALGLSLRVRCRDRVAWIGTAIVSLLFSVEMAFPHRFELADRLRMALKAVGGDEAIRGRRPIQAAMIVVLLVVSVAILAIFLSRSKKLEAPARFAVLGIGVDLFGYTLETISLHQIDQFYIIYWTIWYSGVVLISIGIAGALINRDGAITASPHARYSVASLGRRNDGDRLMDRLVRLVLLMLFLAMPELVDLLIGVLNVRRFFR